MNRIALCIAMLGAPDMALFISGHHRTHMTRGGGDSRRPSFFWDKSGGQSMWQPHQNLATSHKDLRQKYVTSHKESHQKFVTWIFGTYRHIAQITPVPTPDICETRTKKHLFYKHVVQIRAAGLPTFWPAFLNIKILSFCVGDFWITGMLHAGYAHIFHDKRCKNKWCYLLRMMIITSCVKDILRILLPHTYGMATQDANKWRAGTLMRKTRKSDDYFGRRASYYI